MAKQIRVVNLHAIRRDISQRQCRSFPADGEANARSEQPLALRFYTIADLVRLPSPFDTGVVLREPGFNSIELGQQGVCMSRMDINRAQRSGLQCSRFACSLRAMLSP